MIKSFGDYRFLKNFGYMSQWEKSSWHDDGQCYVLSTCAVYNSRITRAKVVEAFAEMELEQKRKKDEEC